MGEPQLVRAPDGRQYRLHRTGPGHGFVYVGQRRVYGTHDWATLMSGQEAYSFVPRGKWAHLLERGAP